MEMKLNRVGKRYDKNWILRNFDWRLDPGKITATIGLNGAGKTTLLYLLAGLFAPSEGEVLVDGERLTRENLRARRRIFFMPDFPVVPHEWPLTKFLASLLILYGQETAGIEANLARLAGELDLEETLEKPLGTLSRGQVYKSAMLCARVLDPELWLLDEPFAAGVDSHGLIVMKRWFSEAKERGRNVVFTTQMPEIAVANADEILLLHDAKASLYSVREGQAIGEGGVPVDLGRQLEVLRCSKRNA